MFHQNNFVVSRFLNRNGITSWRVSGLLHGIRIRKNLKSKDEAHAEKATLELKAVQAASNVRATSTFLTDEQLREAEIAFRLLKARPCSLLMYLEYAHHSFYRMKTGSRI